MDGWYLTEIPFRVPRRLADPACKPIPNPPNPRVGIDPDPTYIGIGNLIGNRTTIPPTNSSID